MTETSSICHEKQSCSLVLKYVQRILFNCSLIFTLLSVTLPVTDCQIDFSALALFSCDKTLNIKSVKK